MPDAYAAGLTLLARRELSTAQLRARLVRRAFDEDDIDAAVARLRQEGALDDRRTALACARTEVHVKRRGRLRVLRQVESLGIDRETARAAVAEVFADVDEDAQMAQALERRLRSGDVSDLRRIQRYLLAQGFDPGKVNAALRARARPQTRT
jgi:regulatory protein